MKRRYFSGYPLWQHLLFWVLFTVYQGVLYNWENTDEIIFHLDFGTAIAVIPVMIMLTYINLGVLMPRFLYQRRYAAYILQLILLILLGGVLIRLLTHVIILPWEQIHDPSRYVKEIKHFWIPLRVLRLAISTLPVLAITMLCVLMKRNYINEKQLRKTEEEHHLAEIRFLKSQVNPHFFFNTLNSLYALALKKSRQLPEMLMRLSDLMHYMIYEAGVNQVLLKDEINYLESLLNLEKLRFADRLDLSYQCAGSADGKLIAPLLFLPLVENAFKHGLGENGWITINFNIEDDLVLFSIENSYSPTEDKRAGGIGLSNLKKRLELIYPGKYTLKLDNHTDSFEASLIIKIT